MMKDKTEQIPVGEPGPVAPDPNRGKLPQPTPPSEPEKKDDPKEDK